MTICLLPFRTPTCGCTERVNTFITRPANSFIMKWGFAGGAWRELRSPLFKNALLLMANSPVNQAFGFLFWFIVARTYSTVDVGLAAASIATVGMLGSIAAFGLGTGLVRYLPEAGDKADLMINSCLTLSGLAGLAAAGIFLLGAQWWAPQMGFLTSHPVYAATFLAVNAASAMAGTANGVFLARRQTRFILWQSVIQGFRIPLPLVLVAFFGVFGIFGSWALAMLVSTAIALLWFIPLVQPGYRPLPKVKRSAIGDLLHFSIVNYLAGIVGVIGGSVLPLVIVNILGPESVAHFYIASMMVGLLERIPAAVTSSLFAEGSQPDANFSRDVRRSARFLVPLMGIGIIVFCFFGDLLLGLFGKEYSDAALRLMQLLALSIGLGVIPGLYGIKLLIQKRVRRIMVLSSVGAIVSLGFVAILLPYRGLTGVGEASLASNGVMAILIGFLWRTDMRMATRRTA